MNTIKTYSVFAEFGRFGPMLEFHRGRSAMLLCLVYYNKIHLVHPIFSSLSMIQTDSHANGHKWSFTPTSHDSTFTLSMLIQYTSHATKVHYPCYKV